MSACSCCAASPAGTRCIPGPESSIDKLAMAKAVQEIGHLIDLLGAAPLVGDAPEWLFEYLTSRGYSIAGGTDQIQKDIVAQRVLGLPRAGENR